VPSDLKIDLGVGEEVEVTRGKETFFPVKFNGFDVGPISVRVVRREEETGEEAYIRAATSAAVMFQAEFDLKLAQYFDRLRGVNKRVEQLKIKRG
jgi:hypothetical protein